MNEDVTLIKYNDILKLNDIANKISSKAANEELSLIISPIKHIESINKYKEIKTTNIFNVKQNENLIKYYYNKEKHQILMSHPINEKIVLKPYDNNTYITNTKPQYENVIQPITNKITSLEIIDTELPNLVCGLEEKIGYGTTFSNLKQLTYNKCKLYKQKEYLIDNQLCIESIKDFGIQHSTAYISKTGIQLEKLIIKDCKFEAQYIYGSLIGPSLKEIIIENLTAPELENIGTIFQMSRCEKVTLRNISAPHLSSITDIFIGCNKLKELELTNVFNNCEHLNYIDSMCKGCVSLEKIIGLETNKFDNIVSIESAFESCTSLDEINLSTLNSWRLERIARAFEMCLNLKKLNIQNIGKADTIIRVSRAFYGIPKECEIIIDRKIRQPINDSTKRSIRALEFYREFWDKIDDSKVISEREFSLFEQTFNYIEGIDNLIISTIEKNILHTERKTGIIDNYKASEIMLILYNTNEELERLIAKAKMFKEIIYQASNCIYIYSEEAECLKVLANKIYINSKPITEDTILRKDK